MSDLMYQIQEITVPQFSFALNPVENETVDPKLKIGGSASLEGEELTIMIRVSTDKDPKSKYYLDAIAKGSMRIKNYVDGEEERKRIKRIGFSTVYPYLRSSLSAAVSVLAAYKLDLGIIDIDTVFEKVNIVVAK